MNNKCLKCNWDGQSIYCPNCGDATFTFEPDLGFYLVNCAANPHYHYIHSKSNRVHGWKKFQEENK